MSATHDPHDSPRPADERSGGGSRWIAVLVGIGVFALVILMIVLHLTGALGPGQH